MILSSAFERLVTATDPVQQVELGLYLIRGENVAIVGEIDEDKDAQVKWQDIRADALKPVVH